MFLCRDALFMTVLLTDLPETFIVALQRRNTFSFQDVKPVSKPASLLSCFHF